MVPKIHKRGSSFKGAAAYLLHDKDRATTSDRVEWVETLNLATEEPDLGWRIMAATSMDANRLKEEAGIRNTGRKSKDHVLHLSLSWHPDEVKELTPEEMMRAAKGALEALGAENRQTMIISHSDEKQPHIHLLINRVSPEDGRLLSSSKEKQNLSKWAQRYEEERGKIFCEERVVNNKARERGEYTRGSKDRPRHILESEQEVANDNPPTLAQQRVFDQQRSKDTALARKVRESLSKHLEKLGKLARSYGSQKSELKARSAIEMAQARQEMRKRFRPDWEKLVQDHRKEFVEFEKRENTVLGRLSNAVQAIDFGAILSGGERRKAISDAFSALSSSGERLQGLKRRHVVQERNLERRQQQAETKGTSVV